MNEEVESVETYTTLSGEVLNLMGLLAEELAYLERCLAAYRSGVSSAEMRELVWTAQNPALRPDPDSPTVGVVTREAYNSPLFRALRDLQDRVDIQAGNVLAMPGDLVDADPVADDWVPTSEAAERLGITMPAIHKAHNAGRLVAKPAREGGKHLVISVNSLRSYQLDERRREAGLQGGRPGPG
jgi:hypothetical protein